MNQKGFATLEVILMVVVIGILATIAVPRFTDITTKANTAKIQADMSTIDSALSIYFMDNVDFKESMTVADDLKEYIKDAENLRPPTGSAYINGTVTKITSTNYEIVIETNDNGLKTAYATLDKHKAGEFSLTKKAE